MDGSPGSPFTTTEAAARESSRAAIRKLLQNEPDSPSKHIRSATALATAAAAPIARKKSNGRRTRRKEKKTNKKTTKSVGSGVIHDDDESPQKGRSPNFQPSEDEALCHQELIGRDNPCLVHSQKLSYMTSTNSIQSTRLRRTLFPVAHPLLKRIL